MVSKATAAALAQKNAPIQIGPTIDKLFEMREAKRQLEAKIKLIEAEYKEIEEKLIEKLRAEETTKGSGKRATASLTPFSVHNIKDYDEVAGFVIKKKCPQLFQRRLSEPAIVEMLAKGIQIPGIEEFNGVRLNVRVIADTI